MDLENLIIMLNDMPENMPLYKDSGLWQIRTDNMEDVIFQQGVNESFYYFIERAYVNSYKSIPESQLYEEALRATCSICVIEGRCLCGELDPIEEDESEGMTYKEFMEENRLSDEDMENDNSPRFI